MTLSIHVTDMGDVEPELAAYFDDTFNDASDRPEPLIELLMGRRERVKTAKSKPLALSLRYAAKAYRAWAAHLEALETAAREGDPAQRSEVREKLKKPNLAEWLGSGTYFVDSSTGATQLFLGPTGS